MTKQGEVRDWQKDMNMIQAYIEHRHLTDYPEQKLAGEPVANVLHYYLQQYAAASNEVCFWRGEATEEKERADGLKAELSEYVLAHWKSFEREKKLREAIDKAMYLINTEAFRLAYDALQESLASLYPEEGEAK